ncbi:hypothetical protein BGZ80_007114 [Entomortierella chlamydospora]|uniref:Peptidase S8/S53 domain-containing protein n=1 Tax=Entomortierella chlamydospora TaxID=101097 RepID=A0A9P6MZK7_9FUNG|nr:hypothetical protein BGZ79_006665 [Entomortierella chlamydospora]KAG0018480.1 hypothetical protein BGZ80_007114 [Entomortierella chlamydospora]
MYGTSMATPYIAGSAALLLEAEPTIDRNEVLSWLQTHSKPGLYRDTSIPDAVSGQGAGMVNNIDGIQGKAFVQPAHLALKDTVHTQESYTITLTNNYDTGETFELSSWPATSILGYTSYGQPTGDVVYNQTSAEVSFAEEDSVYLGPGGTRMYGAYGSVDMLDLQDGYPVLLGPTVDSRLVPILNEAGQSPQVFPMSSNKTVTLVLKISNPLRNLQVYVLNANKKEVLGMVPVDWEYIGWTDSVRSKFFAIHWPGRTIDVYGEVARLPDGDYSLAVVTPKPFSESDNLDDGAHESWVLPVIRIKC